MNLSPEHPLYDADCEQLQSTHFHRVYEDRRRSAFISSGHAASSRPEERSTSSSLRELIILSNSYGLNR